MKKFIKKKSSSLSPNASGPKFRTPDHFKGRKFGKSSTATTRFNPAKFRIQHKG